MMGPGNECNWEFLYESTCTETVRQTFQGFSVSNT